uniref:F-box domain-containing protein n=1 Tax=Brassica oleracea var. oleracea TaxID=109376 RepID=A0A0D3D5G8_BRAOL
MAGELLPNLPDEIIIKILQLIGEQSFYYLGDFLRAGKLGYTLVHEPSVLKICDVTEMVSFVAVKSAIVVGFECSSASASMWATQGLLAMMV